MLQSIVQKEELIRKASKSKARGRSESGHKVNSICNGQSFIRRNSTERIRNIKDYKMGRQIGKGAYAIVRLVIDRSTKEQHAMKIYEKYKLTDPARRKSVTREIAIMK